MAREAVTMSSEETIRQAAEELCREISVLSLWDDPESIFCEDRNNLRAVLQEIEAGALLA